MRIDELLTGLPARVLHGVIGPFCRRCDLRLLLLALVVGTIAAAVTVAAVYGPELAGTGRGGEAPTRTSP